MTKEGRDIALKVGELYATMRLDSGSFDKGLDQSQKNFERLRSGVQQGAQAFATAFAASTTAAAGLGLAALKVGLDYNRMQQTSRAALETLLGSAEAASEQMDRLDDFAKNSPFAKQVFIQAQQQLIGFGMAAEDVVPTLDAIQNAVAAVGGSNEDIAEITRVFAQIQSSGKITADHLNQLSDRGINAAGLLGEAFGKTESEIRDSITNGSLDGREAITVLTEQMMDQFGGATDKIKEQMDGAADRVKAAWRDIGSALAEPLVDPKGGGQLVEWTNSLADAMRAAEDKVAPLVEILVARFQPSLDKITPALQKVQGAIESWDLSNLNSQLDRMTRYTPLIAGVGTALFTMGSTSLPIIGRLVPAINPLVAGFAAMVAFSPELRQTGRDFFDALSPLAPVAAEVGSVLADSLMSALEALAPAASDLLVAVADLTVAFGTGLAPAATTLMTAAVPLVEMFADVVSWVSKLPTPVLGAVAAFAALKGPLKPLVGMLDGVALAILQFSQRSSIHAALGGTNKAMGAMSVAANGARGAIRGVGTAMKTAFISNPVGLAIGALVTAFGALATAQADAKARTDEYKQTLDEFGRATDDTFNKINEALSQDRRNWWEEMWGADANSLIDDAEKFGVAIEDMIGYIVGEEEAINRVNAAMDEYISKNSGSRREKEGANTVTSDFVGTLDQEADALSDAEKETEKKRRADEAGGRATDEAKEKTKSYTEQIKENARALEEQHDKLRQASGAVLSASEAEIRYQDTLENATETIKDNGENLDINTEKGRENQSALNDIGRASLDTMEAMRDNGASTDELSTKMGTLREKFIESAEAAGHSATEARELADDLGLIPGTYTATIEASTTKANANIAEFMRKWDNRTITTYHRLVNSPAGAPPPKGHPAGPQADGGIVEKRADGGIDEAGRHVPRVAQLVTGGRNILWGEPETGWEAYISGKPSERLRNLAVMDQAAKRLGGMFIKPMADGGMSNARTPEPVVAGSGQQPIYITINSVESQYANETAKAVNFALRSRGGRYSRS